jgi:hypothetical protein
MSNNIIPFEPKKRGMNDDLMVELLNNAIDSTRAQGGILLLLGEKDEVAVAVSGELTTRQMSHMACSVIHDAYQIEMDEESPYRA